MGANELLADLTALGRNPDGGYTRLAWDDATMTLREWFAGAAADLGLEVTEDGNGNQVAWWRAAGQANRALLLGSHLDSVPDGGPLDGPLGVASALAALAGLKASGWAPSRPIAVANFSDEEGGRFGVACLGSRLATGAITRDAALALRDDEGSSLGEVMAARGHDPRAAGVASWLDDIEYYIELHIEQGRWLAPHQAAVGVASAIWPHGRYRFDFCGQGNHAGATAMADRRDPMLAYAATVLAARELAVDRVENRPQFGPPADSRRLDRMGDGSSFGPVGARATFGRVQVSPGSTNSIPSRVTAWLDARADAEPALEALVAGIVARAQWAAAGDGTTVTVRAESTSGAVEFDHQLRHRIAGLLDAPVLPTGAGHDAGILAAKLPTAMLFVRNPTGVSHAPEESAAPEDIEAGVDALTKVVEELG
ncbi:Zn-dependent hydrolase [Propionicimonas sp.]|uniref:Zn-dependent hydrolase n=1 Tax=Propionicimonas sp. TaxID=1955623 RepID=UPI0039E38A93